MARQLAESTVAKLRIELQDELNRLTSLLETHQREREEARLSETAAERMPDPLTAEGGSMAFEYEKELSVDQNLEDLVAKAEAALARMDKGTYGVCDMCGESIPLERLETLLYATRCVTCAAKSR